jgi:hypothetical protein
MEVCWCLNTCCAYNDRFIPLRIQGGSRCYIDYAADDNDYDDRVWVLQCYRALYYYMSAQRQSFVCAITFLSLVELLVQLQRPIFALQSVLSFISLTIIAAVRKWKSLLFCLSKRSSRKLHCIIAVYPFASKHYVMVSILYNACNIHPDWWNNCIVFVFNTRKSVYW